MHSIRLSPETIKTLRPAFSDKENDDADDDDEEEEEDGDGDEDDDGHAQHQGQFRNHLDFASGFL